MMTGGNHVVHARRPGAATATANGGGARDWHGMWRWHLALVLLHAAGEQVPVKVAAHYSGSVRAARSGRLTRDDATLLLDGHRFCGIGLSVVDLLWVRQGHDCCHQQNNTRALEAATARGFPFVRFAASPFYANDYWSLRDWRDDPESYWRNGMDKVVALAGKLGGNTRLVPDLLWNPFAFADLCGEPLSALFNGSETCTRRAVADYVTQAARRYSAADEILFW